MVVECFPRYKVNGFRLHTKARNEGKATYNCSVCVKGVGDGDEVSWDYYGILHEVIRVEFTGEQIKKCVLFNCDWFDPNVHWGLRYPKFTPLPRLIITNVIESLTHSYLLILQTKWYTLSTLRGYQEKRIGG